MQVKNFYKILVLSGLCSFGISEFLFSQEFVHARNAVKLYMDTWFVKPAEEYQDWFIDINGLKFPSSGVEAGLKALDDNLKKGSVSTAERIQIRERYIQTYIDQSTILALTYEDILKNPELDLLMQEFLRQVAAQLWLEEELKKDPKSSVPTQDEIDAYYVQNSDRLIRLGLSAAQIRSYTEQELRQKKLQEWTSAKLRSIRELTEVNINPVIRKKLGMAKK
ncbi:MAG: hypothetical protein ACRCTQ_05980 [Brevinemataceae bacterium]